MTQSRREFLKAAAAGATFSAVPVTGPAIPAQSSILTPSQITQLFEHLPGDVAVSIYAPSVGGVGKLRVQYNAGKKLFVASAYKTFLLCELMRQLDSPGIVHTLETALLTLDSTVWSLGSPTFNPPDLAGMVRERATLEAMITSSDNTATDMTTRLAGISNVRDFISSLGLTQTQIPDTTRAFAAYLFGADNYLTTTWDELLNLIAQREGIAVNPFLNDVETLASCAEDFISYYSRALAGEFFQHAETLNEFRRILTLCDYIYLIPLPTGASIYAKSGNADTEGFHARSIAGGMLVANRWAYFAFIINWYAQTPTDPETLNRFFSAINQSMTLIRDSLSGRSLTTWRVG